MRRYHIMFLLLCGLICSQTSIAESTSELKFVDSWNRLAIETIQAKKIPPPLAVQYLATIHLAMFEAANAVDRRYQSLSNINFSQSSVRLDLQRLYVAAAAQRTVAYLASDSVVMKAEALLKDEESHVLATEDDRESVKNQGFALSDRIIAERLSDVAARF